MFRIDNVNPFLGECIPKRLKLDIGISIDSNENRNPKVREEFEIIKDILPKIDKIMYENTLNGGVLEYIKLNTTRYNSEWGTCAITIEPVINLDKLLNNDFSKLYIMELIYKDKNDFIEDDLYLSSIYSENTNKDMQELRIKVDKIKKEIIESIGLREEIIQDEFGEEHNLYFYNEESI
ncbi:hypothetical protein CHL78_000970 [Romboutsia weinsteinii]|uniref:Uncharacterized protein n=1 Tax=Romboutsia weinsteinii TaxID=2020949 RepID=A0A371JAJ5_9FIRM|nr:hypothetical protein [Romboutsia weinsteinii]RDY29774.1 hypothetical protein CHL78_000970 [Romboutsia weinsteinii]